MVQRVIFPTEAGAESASLCVLSDIQYTAGVSGNTLFKCTQEISW